MKTPTSIEERVNEMLAALDAEKPTAPHEILMSALGDALYAADELFGILEKEAARDYAWIEPQIREIYDTINELMKKLERAP